MSFILRTIVRGMKKVNDLSALALQLNNYINSCIIIIIVIVLCHEGIDQSRGATNALSMDT